ncbi:hypothetical protein HanIR_Chr06g0261611 [Helianthus annuus]|nr:hypothetical protein HanIR_Chr06g0261611 [Helianthus annuus]
MGQKEARKRSRIRTPNGLKKKAQVIPERKQTTTKVKELVSGATWIEHTHDARFREDTSLV